MRRTIEYSFELSDGRQLVVDRPDPFVGYDGWRIRIQSKEGGPILTYPATRVVRLKDGGTTRVSCSAGDVFAPFSGQATWNGEPLTKL